MLATDLIRSLAGAGNKIIFDRAASVRTFDGDGHLHVEETNISKATVNPYYGREIPDYERLGLDANRVYRMFRDPAELIKGASTFDGKPLLFNHKPTSAQDHAYDLTVGSVTDARYEAPYLKAKLHIWAGDAIQAIESESKKELSCGYKYTADMTPGTFDGMPYDGVMRDICGNHVALVKEGRAGRDVVVGDKAMENFMQIKSALSRKAALTQGALMAYTRGKLTTDAQIDLAPVLKDVTAENYAAKRPEIVKAMQKQTKGKLAKDASLEDLAEFLESLDDVLPAEVTGDADPDKDGDDDDEEKKKKAAAAKAKEAEDKKARPFGKDKKACDEDPDDDDKVSKSAMDEAIAKAVATAAAAATTEAIKAQTEIREAERFIRPYVGDLQMSFDSAPEVYKKALELRGVKDISDVHPSAYRHLLKALPTAEDLARSKPASSYVTQDAAASDDFNKRYPHIRSITVM